MTPNPSFKRGSGRRLQDQEQPNAAHSEFEERWFTLGLSSEGKLLAVSHTYAATGAASARVRMISAREATRSERRQYEDEPR